MMGRILSTFNEKKMQTNQGNGKLGGETVVARIPSDAVATLKQMRERGLDRRVLPVLEPYQTCRPEVFQQKPLQNKNFFIKEDDTYMFPCQSKKKGCRPNMARQSIDAALDKIRENHVCFYQKQEMESLGKLPW